MKLIKSLLSLNILVVLVSILNAMVFFKLPDGKQPVDFWILALLGNSVWIIYVFDRFFDNYSNQKIITERHVFHNTNQFLLSILALSLILINAVILFFMGKNLLFFGSFIILLVLIYFIIIKYIPKGRLIKELIMPVIYSFAVIGTSFFIKSSINLSSWILAFMFFLIIMQNTLIFSYFEKINNPNIENILKIIQANTIKKIIFYLGSINLFLFIILFKAFETYADKLAFTITIISLLLSFSIIKSEYLSQKERFRWIIDSLFFLFIWLLF